jgi:serine/threonine-protein kinase
VTPDGQLYIADTFNHRIRAVGKDGIITTIAGSDKGHAGDGGLATDALLKGPTYIDLADGELYVADTQNQAVRVLYLR